MNIKLGRILQKALNKRGLGFLTGETYTGYEKTNKRFLGTMLLHKYYITQNNF